MSEQVAEQAPVEESTGPVFEDDMQELVFNKLSAQLNERNAIVSQANAASGDRHSLAEEISESSTDPEIAQAREARDNAILRLDELVRPKVEEVISSVSEDLDSLKADIKAHDEKLTPGITYYKKVYGDEAVKHLPKKLNAKGIGASRSGGGGRRIRGFNVVVVTDDNSVEEFDNFTTAAKWLAVETSELQEQFFAKAGDPKAIKDAPDVVKFQVNFTEVNENDEETERVAGVLAYRADSEEGEQAAQALVAQASE